MRYAAKVDANQPEIVRALEQVGARVLHLHTLGRGAPDILTVYREVLYLMEIKMDKGKLTADEAQFHEAWPGPIFIVRSVEDALRVIGAV